MNIYTLRSSGSWQRGTRRLVAHGAALVLAASAGMAHAATHYDVLVNQDLLLEQAAGNVAADNGPAGGEFIFQSKVKINGASGTLYGVQLTETLPLGAIFQGIGNTSPGVACSNVPAVGTTITANNTTITCTLPSVTATDFTTVDFKVVLPSESTEWKAYATTEPAVDNTDPDSANNSNISRAATTYERADLAVEITSPANGSTVTQGDVVTYTVQASNANSTYAYPLKTGEKAIVRFAQPEGTTFTGTPEGAGWTCEQGSDTSTTPETPYYDCTYTVAEGQSYAKGDALPALGFQSVVDVTGEVPAQASIIGQSAAGVTFTEAAWDNNTTNIEITAEPNNDMDVVLTKTVTPIILDADAGADVPVTYTLKVNRVSGLLEPASITVTDTLPNGVSFTGFTGANWACSAIGQVVTCDYTGTQLGNTQETITINATVAQSALVTGATLTNNAVVAVPNEPSINTNNNQASATMTVSDTVNLSVTKTPSSTVVASGTNYSYSIKLVNNGPLDVKAGQTITITDKLDSRLQFVGVAANSNWTCTPASTDEDTLGAEIICTLNADTALPAGASQTLVLEVIPHFDSQEGQFAQIGNSATVTGIEGRESSIINIPVNSANVNLSQLKADLHIGKAAAITSNTSTYGDGASGSEVVYTLTVKNQVPATALETELQMAKTVIVKDTVNNLINTARATPAGVSLYGNGRYLTAAVTLPDGSTVTADECELSGTNSSTSSTVTCTLRNVPVSNTLAYTVTIKARQYVDPASAADATNTIANTATVSSTDTAEYDNTNNKAEAEVTLKALADMKVEKKSNPLASAAAGQAITYTLTTSNLGPSTAKAVQVVDELPVGAIWVGKPTITSGTCNLQDDRGIATSITAGDVIAAPYTHLACTWSSPDFAIGRQVTVTYVLRSVTENAPQSLYNEVAVSTPTPETDYGNNEANATVTLNEPVVDVQINMQHTNDGIPLEGTTQYTIKVMNSGASESYATGVTMTDIFPATGSTADFEFLQIDSVESSSGASHPVDASSCTTITTDGIVTGLRCNFDWLAPDESVSIKFTMKSSALEEGRAVGTIYHEATVSADLERLPGQDVTANNQTSDRTSTYDAELVDPDTLQYVDLSVSKDATGYPETGLQVGDEFTYTLVVKNEEDPAATPRLDLVNGSAVLEDILPQGLALLSKPANCTYDETSRALRCEIANLAAGASLSHDFVVSVAKLEAGQTRIANTATITSPGDPKDPNNTSTKEVPTVDVAFDLSLTKTVDQAQAKAGATLTYTLVVTNHGPAQSQAGQISDPLPEGLDFIASPEGCTATGTTVNCSVDALAKDESRTFTFTAQIAETVTGPATLANTATITADGDTDDSNNEDTAQTTVPEKTATPTPGGPTPVPTLSQWGQALMAALLAILGLVVLRRRAH